MGPFVTCNEPCPLIFHSKCFRQYPAFTTATSTVDLSALRPADPPPGDWVCMVCRDPPQPLHPEFALPSMRSMVAARGVYIQKILDGENEAKAASGDAVMNTDRDDATPLGLGGREPPSRKRRHSPTYDPTVSHTIVRPASTQASPPAAPALEQPKDNA